MAISNTVMMAVPRTLFFVGLGWVTGCNQKLSDRVTNGITAQVNIDEVIKLFASMELGKDQDSIFQRM